MERDIIRSYATADGGIVTYYRGQNGSWNVDVPVAGNTDTQTYRYPTEELAEMFIRSYINRRGIVFEIENKEIVPESKQTDEDKYHERLGL